MQQLEQVSEVFKRINFVQGKTNLEGINRLEVPTSWPTQDEYEENIDYVLEDPKSIRKSDTDKCKTITCPEEIEYYLRLRNWRHFGQAETEGTPFTTPPYNSRFNW